MNNELKILNIKELNNIVAGVEPTAPKQNGVKMPIYKLSKRELDKRKCLDVFGDHNLQELMPVFPGVTRGDKKSSEDKFISLGGSRVLDLVTGKLLFKLPYEMETLYNTFYFKYPNKRTVENLIEFIRLSNRSWNSGDHTEVFKNFMATLEIDQSILQKPLDEVITY